MVIKAYGAGATGWGSDPQFEHDPGDYKLYINGKFVMDVKAGHWNGFDGNVTGQMWYGFINAEEVFQKNIFTDPYPGNEDQYFHIKNSGAIGLSNGKRTRIELKSTRAPVFTNFQYLAPKAAPYVWVKVFLFLFKDKTLGEQDFSIEGNPAEHTEIINFGWGLDDVDLEGTTPGTKGTIGGFTCNLTLNWPKA